MPHEIRKDRSKGRVVAGVSVLALAGLLAACGGSVDRLSMSHRHSPGRETRIVVLPVQLPANVTPAEADGASLAALYATELLRSYEVLEYERFESGLDRLKIPLDRVLDGAEVAAMDSLGIDCALLSEVYEWKPGKPGILFLAKKGRVGFLARLVDLSTGSVIWSANRIRETEPSESLPLGLSAVFRDLADEMPASLASF
ncbi:MAG: hypothetical protein R3B81_08360 [bacterium]